MEESIELTRGFLVRDPVPLMDSAGELIVLGGRLTLWIIGAPALLFSHFSAELLSIAFETILIHVDLLSLIARASRRKSRLALRTDSRIGVVTRRSRDTRSG
jgi:hypothetical protein